MKIFVVNARRVKKRVIRSCVIIVPLIMAFLLLSFGTKSKEDIYIYSSKEPKEKIIIIDPGHGGEDAGATGVTGVVEKDLNMEISLLIGDELIKRGYTVIFTRTSDRLLYKDEENIKGMRKISDLKNRCAFAEEYPNAIFISIHMNNFGAEKYSGLQVYYSDSNEESESLAKDIQNAVKENLQKDNTRNVKNGKGLYILDNCKATSVIVECGFLSNRVECEKLSEKEYQKELSLSIVYGIIEYIEEN